MRRYSAAALACLLMVALTTAAAPEPTLVHLKPGEPADLHERVPVNFVFVGYDEGEVEAAEFMAGLPNQYRPVVRKRLLYGITEHVGLTYGYDYDLTLASSSYEDDFFARLTELARPAPVTDWQRAYNQQASNVLDVTANHVIDAPTVERWLAENPPEGVDTSENTLFFINWFGRDDFRHHVYVKTNEPDPDTGHNFGVENSSRQIIAWGGTTPDDEENGLGAVRRVWFYDLSAGPEAWTDNWNVDSLDLNGNGVTDYRIPPAWEYTEGGFRSPSELSSDLSMVARYVGIDLLFTPSPLYAPDLTPPDMPRSINLDATTYEGWAGVDASTRFVDPGLLVDELTELRPFGHIDQDNEDVAFKGRARFCYLHWVVDVTCFPQRAYPASGNLFVFNALRLDKRRDDEGSVDYEAPLVSYATGPKLGGRGLLGLADDNYRDGTQSLVFAFVSPFIVQAGYGLTTTMIHETGHHLGLSHPHDGYDYEDGRDFKPVDDFNFAASGSQSNSIMSYIDLNWDFSQFDRDNMNRFLTAAYVTGANVIAGDVLGAQGPAGDISGLVPADGHVGRAQDALAANDYQQAAAEALRAYEEMRAVADAAGVAVIGDDSGTDVDPPVPGAARDGNAYMFVDYLGRRGHRAWP